MKTNRLLIIIANVMIAFTGLLQAKSSLQIPDFAYPQTVISDASVLINTALDDNRDSLLVSGIMQYAIAESIVTDDNLDKILNKVDSAISVESARNNIVAVSILKSIEASIYQRYYLKNRYKFQSRQESTGQLPADVNEWSARQICDKVVTLCSESVSNRDVLAKCSVKNLGSAINYGNSANTYGEAIVPNMYALLMWRAIDICNKISNDVGSSELFKLCADLISYYKESGNDLPLMYIYSIYPDEALKLEGIVGDNRFDNLKQLYAKYQSSQYSAMLFNSMSNVVIDDDERMELYNTVDKFMNRYPDYQFMRDVEDVVIVLLKHEARLEMPKAIKCGQSIKAAVTLDNINDLDVSIYRCPDGVSDYKINQCKIIETQSLHNDYEQPFYSKIDSIELKPLSYGKYVVVLSVGAGKAKRESYRHEFVVTDLYAYLTWNNKQNDETEVVVVDASTGYPKKGVKVNCYHSNYRNPTKKLLSSKYTDANGLAKFKLKENGDADFVPISGSDKYSYAVNRYQYSIPSPKVKRSACILTDLAVYRPGGDVKFVVISYTRDEKNRKYAPIVEARFKSYLVNASGSVIDSLEMTTDSWGRAAGAYKLPEGGMNGTFRIKVVEHDGSDKKSTEIASKQINVAEYKTPQFFVELYNTKSNYSAKLPQIVLNGSAKMYSGVPEQNAKVKCEVRMSQSLWWRSPSNGEVVEVQQSSTNSDGSFTLALNVPDLLNKAANTQFAKGCLYSASIAVTSMTGESHTITDYFTIGIGGEIVITPDVSVEATRSAKLPVKVITYGPDSVAYCKYEFIKADNSIALSGVSNADSIVVDLSTVPSGKYQLKVSLCGDSTVSAMASMVVYRADDKKCPIKSPLWVPYNSAQQSRTGEVEFIVGSDTPSYIRYVAYTPSGRVANGTFDLKAGQSHINIKLPKDIKERVTIDLVTVKNFSMITNSLMVEPIEKPESLEISVSSFRDKINAGDVEHWKFVTKNNRGSYIKSAVLVDVYDAAVDAIAPNYFSLHFPAFYNSFSVGYLPNLRLRGQIISYLSWSDRNDYPCVEITRPEINSYNMSFFSNTNTNGIYVRGLSMKKESVMYAAAAPVETSEEVQVESTSYQVSDKVFLTGGLGIQESFDDADAGSKSSDDVSDTTPLREGTPTTALWQPYLSTDSLTGELQIEFDAPNYNTRWLLNAVAYNAEMLVGNLNRQLEVSKPIMVQPNLPRFLRNGDEAVISAQIINNSSENRVISVLVELFRPSDNRVIYSKLVSISLNAGQSQQFDVEWLVPDDISLVGYRIVVNSDNYTDGEQNIIPILSIVTPVIESQPFYINPSEKQVSLEVNDFHQSAEITFTYCDNMAWPCITALPSIFNASSILVGDIINTLFAIYMASGISKDYPNIGKAVSYWKQHPSDSMLVSQLSKNGNLKISNIENSPWLSVAESQTLQMQTIDKLFDESYVNDIKLATLNSLKELQEPNGSFKWYKEGVGSYFMTLAVLEKLGNVNMCGYLPAHDDDLNSMVESAINYIDREIINMYNKQKDKRDYSIFYRFAYVRLMFPQHKLSNTLQQLTANAVKEVEKNWRKLSGDQKAYLIVLLCRSGNVAKAEPIYKSLLQFAINTPDRGTYWDNIGDRYGYFSNKLAATSMMLQAIKLVNPESSIIDKVRQWMLYDKQVNGWSSQSVATQAIYALLSSGTDWINTSITDSLDINICGNKIPLDDFERYTGSVTKSIISESSNRLLTISRGSNSPAWGAIIAKYSAPVDEIKAASIDGLSINKELYRVSGNDLLQEQQFHVGDKVRVMLTVKTSRDMDYVVIKDERSATMEPVAQLSSYTSTNNVWYFQEIKDSGTNMFVYYLPKGVHTIYYDVMITSEGEYSSGIATVQSQEQPAIIAHSGGCKVVVK